MCFINLLMFHAQVLNLIKDDSVETYFHEQNQLLNLYVNEYHNQLLEKLGIINSNSNISKMREISKIIAYDTQALVSVNFMLKFPGKDVLFDNLTDYNSLTLIGSVRDCVYGSLCQLCRNETDSVFFCTYSDKEEVLYSFFLTEIDKENGVWELSHFMKNFKIIFKI